MKYFHWNASFLWWFIIHLNNLLKSPAAEPLQTHAWLFENETRTHAPACTLGHLRGLGCLCLVCLELLASLHLHGAVDNPIGSQRLQPLHFHDHHLGSVDITAICCSPGVIHPATWRSKRKGENLEQTRCRQILAVFLDFIHSMPCQPELQCTLLH